MVKNTNLNWLKSSDLLSNIVIILKPLDFFAVFYYLF